MITKPAGTPMTEAQFSYLISLIGQVFPDQPAMRAKALVEAAGLDFNGASSEIDSAKAILKHKPAAAAAVEPPAYVPPFGHYMIDGKHVHLKKSKHGSVYVLVDDVYVGILGKSYVATAAIAALDSADAAYAAVVAFAAATSKCGVCHTKLTDPKSIAAGIGPVCAKKYGKTI